MSLLSTEPECCEQSYANDPYTYVSKNGMGYVVNDYIASIGITSVDSSSVKRYNKLIPKGRPDDHFPIGCVVRFDVGGGPTISKRRALEYDRSKIGIDEFDELFISNLGRVPAIPFAVDQASHCHIINNHINNAAITAYPFSKYVNFNDKFTLPTCNKIIERNKVVCVYSKIKKAHTRLHLYFVFNFW